MYNNDVMEGLSVYTPATGQSSQIFLLKFQLSLFRLTADTLNTLTDCGLKKNTQMSKWTYIPNFETKITFLT